MPVSGALCTLLGDGDDNEERSLGTASTDVNGLASFDLPASIKLRLHVEAPQPSNIAITERIDFTRCGTRDEPLEVRLPLGCTYAGMVRDTRGTMIIGAYIEPIDLAFRGGGFGATSYRTNEKGEFEIHGFGKGPYTWKVGGEGFRTEFREVSFVADGQIIRDDVTLRDAPPNVKLSLRFLDARGSGVKGVEARVDMFFPIDGKAGGHSTIGGTGDEGSSDNGEASGYVAGEHLTQPGARLYIKIAANGYVMRVDEIPLSELLGKTEWKREFVLDVAPVVTGKVIPRPDDLEYKSLEEWSGTVAIQPLSGGDAWPWPYVVSTASGGGFKIDTLPPGEYTVTDPVYAAVHGSSASIQGTFRVPRESPLIIDLAHGILR